MLEKLYSIYKESFPKYPVSKEAFHHSLKPDYAQLFRKYHKDKLIGYCIVSGGAVTMLCVSPRYRNNGIGSELLSQAEKYIAKQNKTRITLGRGCENYLLQGVPTENEGAVEFFQKRGYTSDFVSVNMTLKMGDYCPERLTIPPCGNVTFRLAEKSEQAAVCEAVSKVAEDWVCYFKDSGEDCLVAEKNGVICGFQLLSADGGLFKRPHEKLGSIGCVGVIPEARKQGIGLQMVMAGANLLKNKGCTGIELRYVELVDWYGRLGFVADKKMWMGEKTMSENVDSI